MSSTQSLRNWEICAALCAQTCSKASWQRAASNESNSYSWSFPWSQVNFSNSPGGCSRDQEGSTLSWQLGKTTSLSGLKHKTWFLKAGSLSGRGWLAGDTLDELREYFPWTGGSESGNFLLHIQQAEMALNGQWQLCSGSSEPWSLLPIQYYPLALCLVTAQTWGSRSAQKEIKTKNRQKVLRACKNTQQTCLQMMLYTTLFLIYV